MDLVEALRTTGAVREFRPEPVADEVVVRLLDTARFGPNGGNRQAWKVIVVKDPGIRRRLAELYQAGFHVYGAMARSGLTPFAPVTDRDAEAAAVAAAGPAPAGRVAGLSGHLDEVPVLLTVLADLRRLAAIDRDLGRYTLVGGASIYPFVWSILLAARAEGLGGVITTIAIQHEPEVLELLGAVGEPVALAAVVCLGWPVHQPTRLRRDPVESFATVDRLDGPPLS